MLQMEYKLVSWVLMELNYGTNCFQFGQSRMHLTTKAHFFAKQPPSVWKYSDNLPFVSWLFFFPVVSSRLYKAFTVARELKATRLNYSASLAGGLLVLSGSLLMAYSVESDTMGNSRVHHRHSAFSMNSTLFPLACFVFLFCFVLVYLNQIPDSK